MRQLLETTGRKGTDILDEYENKQDLSEKSRKKLVALCVSFMTRHSSGKLPPKTERVEYAEALVTLFPALKDSDSRLGYVSIPT